MVFVNDRVSDLLTRLRNGYNAKLLNVTVLNSKIIISILSVLQRLGYIRSFKIVNNKEIHVTLVYYRNQPGIRHVRRVSKLSKRLYMKSKDLKVKLSKASSASGFYVLSTNRGILVDVEADLINTGGEVLFEIY